MNTTEIANRLVELCRTGQIQEAQKELFSDDIVSIEPDHSNFETARGRKAVGEKANQIASVVEERHGGSFSDPVIAGNHFSLSMILDATFKGQGRMKLEEICLYEVKNGKIISEQFFF